MRREHITISYLTKPTGKALERFEDMLSRRLEAYREQLRKDDEAAIAARIKVRDDYVKEAEEILRHYILSNSSKRR